MTRRLINYSFNFEKFIINEALFDQSLNNIYSKKLIVYWALKFSIQSQFVLIQFELDWKVWDRPNIAVTYSF